MNHMCAGASEGQKDPPAQSPLSKHYHCLAHAIAGPYLGVKIIIDDIYVMLSRCWGLSSALYK